MSGLTKFLPTYKNIWLLSFPLIVAGISETIIGITDTIFLSYYGTTELAALGLADTIYVISLFLIFGFIDGIQITIGRRAGEEQHKNIGKVLNQGLYLLAVISSLMILLVLHVIPLITIELFQSNEIYESVELYLSIAIYGLFFHAFNLAMSAFYVGISRTRVFIKATIILAVTNISLDYLLIFGNYGFSEMGIEGAAVASLVAEIAVSLFLITDIIRHRYIKTYGLFIFEKVNFTIIKTLTMLSAPVSMEALIESLRWFTFFLIIEQLGEDALAATTIIFSCYAILLIPIDAFSETICSMVSNLLGQKDEKKVTQLVLKTVALGYLTVLPALIVTIFFPEYILAIFSESENITQTIITTLMIVSFATMLAVPANIIASAVTGTGDTMINLFIEIIVSLIILSYTYYVAIIANLSLNYIWFAEVIGWGVCLLLSWLWLKSNLWKRLNI
ncbi:MATE family efflux transporter [Candidatus Sulfurimonas marisnigri]|uniref:Multidrug-efflux transporter n=1 Tax=Candidatus Sulfurimonas marisnigri TaxID=2740405 RepID=A0A7S7M174_9BACT|nr:MATE family efflux transporter [Candidatus Sulfurimonas marisnigri]QOY54693.1 MATE family efflux transporter [Candidatus Sulfurimonas marisnigri]